MRGSVLWAFSLTLVAGLYGLVGGMFILAAAVWLLS